MTIRLGRTGYQLLDAGYRTGPSIQYPVSSICRVQFFSLLLSGRLAKSFQLTLKVGAIFTG